MTPRSYSPAQFLPGNIRALTAHCTATRQGAPRATVADVFQEGGGFFLFFFFEVCEKLVYCCSAIVSLQAFVFERLYKVSSETLLKGGNFVLTVPPHSVTHTRQFLIWRPFAKEIKHLPESAPYPGLISPTVNTWLNGGFFFFFFLIIRQQTFCSRWLIGAWAPLKCFCRQQPSRCFFTAAKTSDCNAENVVIKNPFSFAFIFFFYLKMLFFLSY